MLTSIPSGAGSTPPPSANTSRTPHRVLDVLADGGGVLPAPLGIEVSIADDVQRRLLGQIRLRSLGPRAGKRDRKGQVEGASHMMPNRLTQGAAKRHGQRRGIYWCKPVPNRSRTKCSIECAMP